MSFVDIACQVREVRMQVDFCTGEPSVASISAHLKQLHPAFFQFREHQMPHLVWCELRQMQRVSDTVEDVLHRPFANGLAGIALRVREKNGTIPVGAVALDEGSTIPLDVLFEATPGRMREDNGAGQFVFRDLGLDSNGMGTPVDIIGAQEHDLLRVYEFVVGRQGKKKGVSSWLRQG